MDELSKNSVTGDKNILEKTISVSQSSRKYLNRKQKNSSFNSKPNSLSRSRDKSMALLSNMNDLLGRERSIIFFIEKMEKEISQFDAAKTVPGQKTGMKELRKIRETLDFYRMRKKSKKKKKGRSKIAGNYRNLVAGKSRMRYENLKKSKK